MTAQDQGQGQQRQQQQIRPEDRKLEIVGSRMWTSWMAEQQVSLMFSTYQAGKLFLIGTKKDGKMSIFERTFSRIMGMTTANEGNTLYMSTLYQLWRLDNVIPKGQEANGADLMYLPTAAYTTGDVDVHDLGVDADGNVVFVNCLFSCVGALSPGYSFKPIWKPKFISRIVAEERCHLNGLAMKDGKLGYCTAISDTDVAEGWRDHRADGGIVMDCESNEIICKGLSMPHSPRWHNGKLWVLQSGTGEFGYIDLKAGKFEPIAFCPGYLRGMTFIGDFAVVGLSEPRNRTFTGLPLDGLLEKHRVEARCGLQVIDLRDGSCPHSLRCEGLVKELYDVIALPQVRQPQAVGLVKEDIRRTIRIDDEGFDIGAAPAEGEKGSAKGKKKGSK